MISLLALVTFVSVAQADPGFQTGNDFQAIFLDGEISVSCRDPGTGQSEFASFRCVYETLEPAEGVRFQGPKIDADTVKIRSLREDGSVREKSDGYVSTTGLSRGHFNLWIATLTQRPLLKFGRNQIDYTLEKQNQVVRSGQFTATVSAGEDRSCRARRQYFSDDLGDCRSSQNLCGRFFREENYCK